MTMSPPTDQIPIPSWQITDLDQLSASGELSGIDPNVLAVMSQEESGGEEAGAGINSEGYGGYFGLGANKSYPGGTISSAEMEQNTPQSFLDQAKVAASAFASYWTGNVLTTEDVYQTGKQEGGQSAGAQLMASELQPSELAGTGTAPVAATGTTGTTGTGTATTDASLNANPLDLFGIPQTVGSSAASAVWSEVGPFAVKAILVVAGLGIIVLAAYKAASPIAKRNEQTVQSAAGPLADLAAA
jgi:hypothetical protein